MDAPALELITPKHSARSPKARCRETLEFLESTKNDLEKSVVHYAMRAVGEGAEEEVGSSLGHLP